MPTTDDNGGFENEKLEILTAAAALVAVMGFAGTAKAATGLGPSEYLCFDTANTTATGNCAGMDSPFAGLGLDFFHLEDFEDGILNTPGVSAVGKDLQVICKHPSQDSVDEDDGDIDGSGLGGCSLFSIAAGTPTNTAKITFTFDENDLPMFPTHVGIVWTDGFRGVDFEAFDENGALIADCTSLGEHTGAFLFSGQTDEDRFYGCINDSGISNIEISMAAGVSTGIEVDHLQYGKIAAIRTLDCEGFFPPFDQALLLKKKSKRAIPVKMVLFDGDTEITDLDLSAPPVVEVRVGVDTGSGIPGFDEDLLPPGLSDDGNEFRYDPDDMQWIINLATKQYKASLTYVVTAISGDPSSYVINPSCSQEFTRP